MSTLHSDLIIVVKNNKTNRELNHHHNVVPRTGDKLVISKKLWLVNEVVWYSEWSKCNKINPRIHHEVTIYVDKTK